MHVKHPHLVTNKSNKAGLSCDKCDFIIHNNEHRRKHMKVRHGVKDRLLWIGDSVNSNLNFDDLANTIDMEVKPVNAYTAPVL